MAWKITRVTKTFTFDAAHTLDNHDGKCSAVHGHTYKIEIGVEGVPQLVHTSNPQSGMIIDFGRLKDIVKEGVIELFDHSDLNSYIDYPTAELIAAEIFNMLENDIFGIEVAPAWRPTEWVPPHLVSVKVWETPTSCAEVYTI